MDDVVSVSLAVDNLKTDCDHTASHLRLRDRIRAIEGCEEANALLRLHGAAQDALAALRSMLSRLHLLAQRLHIESFFLEVVKSLLLEGVIYRGGTEFQYTSNSYQLTGILKKAENEYKGQKSLLGCSHGLLSTMKRQDVIDRVILVVGFLIFVMVVLYVVSKRTGVLKL